MESDASDAQHKCKRSPCCSHLKNSTDVRLGIELRFAPPVLFHHPVCFSG